MRVISGVARGYIAPSRGAEKTRISARFFIDALLQDRYLVSSACGRLRTGRFWAEILKSGRSLGIHGGSHVLKTPHSVANLARV